MTRKRPEWFTCNGGLNLKRQIFRFIQTAMILMKKEVTQVIRSRLET